MDYAVAPRGYRVLSKVPRLPDHVIDHVVGHFNGLEAFVRASLGGEQEPPHLGNRSARWAPQGAYQHNRGRGIIGLQREDALTTGYRLTKPLEPQQLPRTAGPGLQKAGRQRDSALVACEGPQRVSRDRQQIPQVVAAVLLNLLAFAFHTVADLTYDLWLQAVNKAGARSRFFEHLRAITIFLVFPSWQSLLTTLAFAQPPSQPP